MARMRITGFNSDESTETFTRAIQFASDEEVIRVIDFSFEEGWVLIENDNEPTCDDYEVDWKFL